MATQGQSVWIVQSIDYWEGTDPEPMAAFTDETAAQEWAKGRYPDECEVYFHAIPLNPSAVAAKMQEGAG